MMLVAQMGRMIVTVLLAFASSSARADEAMALAEHVVTTASKGDIKAALSTFITFSERKQMGMHLGKEKGDLIEFAVRSGLPESGPAVVFEAGCHAGDGTLSAISGLQGRAASTVVSTEANKQWLSAAKRVVSHALGDSDVTHIPLLLADDADFGKFLDELKEQHGISKFDAVVLDHDEKLFLPHLKIILAKDFLRIGGTVQIDNVKRKAAALSDYMKFVNSKSPNGFQTETKTVKNPYPDAIAISTFVGRASEL